MRRHKPHVFRRSRSGFTLAEAAVLVAGIALGVALIAPTLGGMRTEARLAGSRDNLRQLGAAHAAYSEANNGFIATFDWEGRPGTFGSPAAEYEIGCGLVQVAPSNLDGAQLQLAAILRKATGRCGDRDDAINVNFQRVPHRRYSHQVLLDWMGASPTDPVSLSPLDIEHQRFQSLTTPEEYSGLPGGDPDTAAEGAWQSTQTIQAWPYASSYLSTVYSYSDSTPGAFGLPLFPSSDATLFQLSDISRLRPQPRFTVRHPALKAHMFEEFDYSQGLSNAGRFYADPEASINVLAFDGSSRRVATADANPGWDPSVPDDMGQAAQLRYSSIDTRFFVDDSERPDAYPGHYMWTRGGLFGIDFGAGEINTSEW